MYQLNEQAVAQQMVCPHCGQTVCVMNDEFNALVEAGYDKPSQQPAVTCPTCGAVSYMSSGKRLQPYLVSRKGWTVQQEILRQKDQGMFYPKGLVDVECSCGNKFQIPECDADRMASEYFPFNCPKCNSFCVLPGSPPEPAAGWTTGFGFLRTHVCPNCGYPTYDRFKKGLTAGGSQFRQCGKCGSVSLVPSQEFMHRRYDPAYGARMDAEDEARRRYWRDYNIKLFCVKAMVACFMCGIIMAANGAFLHGMPSNPTGMPGQWETIRGLEIFMIAWPQMVVAMIVSIFCPPWFRNRNGESLVS